MMSVKLGKIVDLDVVRDTRCERTKTSRSITVVIPRFEIFDVVVLELFFQREVIELASQCELAVYFFLADVEVVDIEEANMANSMLKLFDELLLAAGLSNLPRSRVMSSAQSKSSLVTGTCW